MRLLTRRHRRLGTLVVLSALSAGPTLSAQDGGRSSAEPVFEKASEILQRTRGGDFTTQSEAAEQAADLLREFVDANPDHPEAGRAHSERGRILLHQARALTGRISSDSDDAVRTEVRQQARGLIDEAEAAFEQAHEIHEAVWKRFPVFVNAGDAEQRTAKHKAEVAYIQDQLALATCLYERGLTFDSDRHEREDLLNRAANQFGTLHRKYRSLMAGLYARRWQGKCFESQGKVDEALDIYAELLGHPGESTTIQDLRNRARHFRLICLNHDRKQDYQLAVDEATAWLAHNEGQSRTQIGLAIRYERLRAVMNLAHRSEARNRPMLEQALADATWIAAQPGPLQQAANDLLPSLRAALAPRAD